MPTVLLFRLRRENCEREAFLLIFGSSFVPAGVKLVPWGFTKQMNRAYGRLSCPCSRVELEKDYARAMKRSRSQHYA